MRSGGSIEGVARGFTSLIDAARSAESVASYERCLFDVLQREIGFDVAFCARESGPGPYSPGFLDTVRAQTARSWQRYGEQLRPLLAAQQAQGGVIVDVEFFGERRLERLAYYQELMRPHGGRSSLLGALTAGPQQLLGKVMLGRTRARVRAKEQRTLQRVLPLLSLCELALQRTTARPPAAALSAKLTAREREVLGYLQLGYTNPQIASACGSAPRTVRNQLSAIFAKLGASTRAEAVALSLGHVPGGE
jgi:DNA-binding CsgD family transcriptional regulator